MNDSAPLAVSEARASSPTRGDALKKPLSNKLVAIFLPWVGLSLLLLFSVLEVLYYQDERAALIHRLNSLVNIQAENFKSALAHGDMEQIKALTSALGRLPDVRGAMVLDDKNKRIAYAGSIFLPPEAPDFRTVQPLERNVSGRNETIGRLVVIAHSDEIWRNVRHHLWVNLLILLVLQASISASVLIASRRVIGRPLQRLWENIALSEAGETHEPVQWADDDEIGRVVKAYNIMQQQRAASEAEVRHYQQHLEEKVRARTSALARSEAQWRTLVDNIPGVVYRCLLDERWTMLFISDEIRRISGYPATDFLNKESVRSLADIIHPDDRQGVWDKINQDIRERRPMASEYRIIDLAGRIHYLFAKGQAIFDSDGRALYLDGTIFDVTEQKEAELALKESRERLELALEGGNLGFWDVDLVSGQMVVDERWADMLGYALAELQPTWRDFWLATLHEEDRERVLAAGEACREGHVPNFEVEYRALTKDGQVRWLFTKGGVVARDEEGRPLRMVGTVMDVTARKEAEERLRETELKLQKTLADRGRALESLVKTRTAQLEETQEALREAMRNLQVTEITTGVFWLQVPEADLYVLCGCPAEVVKHMMRTGHVATERKGDISCETGPNAILLSDLMMQNGSFSNLAEFPVLQMLYRQGLILPGHPNNTGKKPILIGSPEQVAAQINYIHRGNYGLVSHEELVAAGVEAEDARWMMSVKKHFAFGNIRPPESFLETVVVGDGEAVEIKNGVTVRRVALNRFAFSFRERTVEVNLNLPSGQPYQSPYTLDFHQVPREYFAVLHSGEGDGWDIRRPSMSSILMYDGQILLVDAPPNVKHTLQTLGIDLSEVEGVFHTHSHDDHFIGLLDLIQAGHRLKYYATSMVIAATDKKLSALLSLGEGALHQFFKVRVLTLDQWSEYDGLQVKPLYSPHPLENNILLFRAQGENGEEKTYAHWADLTAFGVLDGMARKEGSGISPRLIDKIKADYLTPATLKKLDVGGGMIHGLAEDFADDPSERLFLAHMARPLSDSEKEIGSAAPFGALDILIPAGRDYLRERARTNFSAVFPRIPHEAMESLLSSPIVEINPGSIISRGGDVVDSVSMILTGVVEYVNASTGVCNHLATGAFIGTQALFHDPSPTGTWRAVSSVRLMRFPLERLRDLLDGHALMEPLRVIMSKIRFLLESWLFGEMLTLATLIRIANGLVVSRVKAGRFRLSAGKPILFMVRSGVVVLELGEEERLERGDFFGELGFLADPPVALSCRVEGEAELVRLDLPTLLKIPIVHWKLLEVSTRRRRLLTAPPA